MGKEPVVSDQSQPVRAQAEPRDGGLSAFRLNLEQQRKRAKDLQRALRDGEAAALRRFRQHHPDGATIIDGALDQRLTRLSEAQLAIARELRLPSWPKLKAHVLAMERARQDMSERRPALDGDVRTLHIRCGSDLKSTLTDGGFAGDFLEYSNPFCQGPVVDDPDWLTLRASYIAATYGAWVGRSHEQITQGLLRAEQDLCSAAQHYERVVMWFEHDSYDQLILARCLAQFSETRPRRLELVSVDRFPGGMRFIGLGQLPPEALRLLWGRRHTVSEPQLHAGRAVWDMLRSPDPTSLAAAARRGIPELPYLAGAVRRHCQELPWIGDGMSLTERLVLELVAERPRTAGEVFRDLMEEREPLPWLGDIGLRGIVDVMKRVREKVFTTTFDGDDRRWNRERLTITALGRAVLAGEVDWLSLSPPERWVGGVRIEAASGCWRWDAPRAGVAMTPPGAAGG
jgi:hypothetical protein